MEKTAVSHGYTVAMEESEHFAAGRKEPDIDKSPAAYYPAVRKVADWALLLYMKTPP